MHRVFLVIVCGVGRENGVRGRGGMKTVHEVMVTNKSVMRAKYPVFYVHLYTTIQAELVLKGKSGLKGVQGLSRCGFPRKTVPLRDCAREERHLAVLGATGWNVVAADVVLPGT